MAKFLLVFFATFIVYQNSYAQEKHIISQYYDHGWVPVNGIDGAAHLRIVDACKDGYIVKDFDLNGRIETEGVYTLVNDNFVKQGKTIVYFENGVIQEEGAYTNDQQTGFHKLFYEDGTLKSELFYNRGQTKHGQFCTPEGLALLHHGMGTIVEPNPEGIFLTYTEIRDSLAVKNYHVNIVTLDTLYTVVEEQAKYIGGYEALYRDIKMALKEIGRTYRITDNGKVFVSFIVEKDGTINEYKVIKGATAELDALSLKIISMLKTFEPAIQNGKPVRSTFVLPIRFAKE